MMDPELLFAIERIVGFVANFAVCAVTVTFFLQTRKHCFSLIGLSAGIGALLYLFPGIAATFGRVLDLADLVLWMVGFFMLLADYREALRMAAQQECEVGSAPG